MTDAVGSKFSPGGSFPRGFLQTVSSDGIAAKRGRDSAYQSPVEDAQEVLSCDRTCGGKGELSKK